MRWLTHFGLSQVARWWAMQDMQSHQSLQMVVAVLAES